MNSPVALENYFRLMTANGAVQIYQAAWRHGIFDALAAGPLTTRALAEITSLNEDALRLVLDGLVAIGALESSGHEHRLGAVMQALAGNYRSLGDEYWRHLDEYLKTGQPLRRMNTVAEGEAAYRNQAAALAWMMSPAAGTVAQKLSSHLPPTAKILDLGAGSGVWSLALLGALPASTATLVDWPAVLDVARQFARQAGLTSRIHCEPGDYHRLQLAPGTHDLALLGNICHLETAEGNRALFERAAAWLKPGGRIAIIDVCPTQEPLAASLYAIGLALRTDSAAVPRSEDIHRWLEQAGFDHPEYSALQAPPGTMALWTATLR